MSHNEGDQQWFEDAFLFCCAPHGDVLASKERREVVERRGMAPPSNDVNMREERNSSSSDGSNRLSSNASVIRVRTFSAERGYHYTKIAVHDSSAVETKPHFEAKHQPKVLSPPASADHSEAQKKQIANFDELVAKSNPGKMHHVSDPIISPPPSSHERLGHTSLVGISWVVEDYRLGGTMNLEEARPNNTLWVTACDGEDTDPFVVTVPSSVQTISIFKCSHLVVKCHSTSSLMVNDCESVIVELRSCRPSPPFASWDRSRSCLLLTKDDTPASAFSGKAVSVASEDIRILDTMGDEFDVHRNGTTKSKTIVVPNDSLQDIAPMATLKPGQTPVTFETVVVPNDKGSISSKTFVVQKDPWIGDSLFVPLAQTKSKLALPEAHPLVPEGSGGKTQNVAADGEAAPTSAPEEGDANPAAGGAAEAAPTPAPDSASRPKAVDYPLVPSPPASLSPLAALPAVQGGGVQQVLEGPPLSPESGGNVKDYPLKMSI